MKLPSTIKFLLLTLLTHLYAIPSPPQAEGLRGPRYRVQFQKWYKQYDFIFASLLSQNCSSQYTNYLHDTPSNATINWFSGGDEQNTLTEPVLTCLLENTPQYVMISLQNAQILLGLTPTILAILGASSEESATLAVVGTRPLLSLLLACGSPSVYLSRAFDFKDPVEILSKHRPQRYRPGNKMRSPIFHGPLLVIQYMVALGATANIAMLNYELGVQAICGFSSNWIFMPTFWSSSVMGIYIWGVFWHLLRVRRVLPDGPSTVWGHVWRRLRAEFRLSLNNGPVKVKTLAEGKRHIVLGWALSVFSILHIIFGTMTLSSLLFIGPRDALKVIARFVGSGLFCRIITMYELAGLRENYECTVEGTTIGGGIQDGSSEDIEKGTGQDAPRVTVVSTTTRLKNVSGDGHLEGVPRSKTSFV